MKIIQSFLYQIQVHFIFIPSFNLIILIKSIPSIPTPSIPVTLVTSIILLVILLFITHFIPTFAIILHFILFITHPNFIIILTHFQIFLLPIHLFDSFTISLIILLLSLLQNHYF